MNESGLSQVFLPFWVDVTSGLPDPNHNHNPHETISNKVLRLKGSPMQSLNLIM